MMSTYLELPIRTQDRLYGWDAVYGKGASGILEENTPFLGSGVIEGLGFPGRVENGVAPRPPLPVYGEGAGGIDKRVFRDGGVTNAHTQAVGGRNPYGGDRARPTRKSGMYNRQSCAANDRYEMAGVAPCPSLKALLDSLLKLQGQAVKS